METPVILILFRRPETTRRVFEAVRYMQPKHLVLVADGPRNDEEAESCQRTREVVASIDWNCEVIRDYSDHNLGVAKRVSSGISKAFEEFPEAIILEDDTLPCPFFFDYCEELLDYWRDDSRVMHISGTNFLHKQTAGYPYSYFFNRHPAVWGWATWRQAWQHHQLDLPGWPEAVRDVLLQENLYTSHGMRIWKETFDLHYDNLDPWSWAYHWVYAVWKQKGLCITPRTNLVENIGFGEGATHTGGDSIAPDLPIHNDFNEKLSHPVEAQMDVKLERMMEKYLFPQPRSWLSRAFGKLGRLLTSSFKNNS